MYTTVAFSVAAPLVGTRAEMIAAVEPVEIEIFATTTPFGVIQILSKSSIVPDAEPVPAAGTV